jgi:hypothetical protein
MSIAYAEVISEMRIHLRIITSDLCKCLLFHLFSFLSLQIVDVFHSLTDLRVSYKKQELLTLRQHLMLLPGFWWGPCCSIFLVFCFLCFVCLLSVSCVPNAVSVSGLSILDCPFGFL